ncbi:MAG: signal peptidase II [Pseudomonadota bacterium]
MRAWPWLLLAALVIAADQLSKALVVAQLTFAEEVPVTPFFSWVHLCNSGAAFSFLQGAGGWQRWLFIGLAAAFTVFILYELRRLPRGERLMGWVYGLILGGAIGNAIDRALNGCVVDFLAFHYDTAYFPAFNVADSALFCGAVLWIGQMIGEYRAERSHG